jgi:hypothetical protein
MVSDQLQENGNGKGSGGGATSSPLEEGVKHLNVPLVLGLVEEFVGYARVTARLTRSLGLSAPKTKLTRLSRSGESNLRTRVRGFESFGDFCGRKKDSSL